jgi:hypothetical protein
MLSKPLEVHFDAPDTTSDGGAVLVKAVDDRLGLTENMISHLIDDRQPSKVVHSFTDMFRQRVFGLACGYADVNDVARIGRDPLHKSLLGRNAVTDADLASQPTLSRFENILGPKDLYRMSQALCETVLDRHQKRLRKVRLVTIDMDPTDDATYGQQELAFFNGHYSSWCYLPMLSFVRFNAENEQYLVSAVLRSGVASAREGAIGILRRVIDAVRKRFPRARIRVRLDGGFAGPEMFDYLESEEVEYLVAMAKNSVLASRARRPLGHARRLSRESGKSVAVFGETRYAAKSWKKHKRRVIYKAEVVRLDDRTPRDNCRFVVTNLPYTPKNVYKVYRQRGDSENRIKEAKNSLYMDRTSCSRFWANQLRVLMTATAFVLFQEMRLKLKRTSLAGAQVETIRLKLLKIGGRLKTTVRRRVLHLSEHHPWANAWIQVARLLGAT